MKRNGSFNTGHALGLKIAIVFRIFQFSNLCLEGEGRASSDRRTSPFVSAVAGQNRNGLTVCCSQSANGETTNFYRQGEMNNGTDTL
jgi:hypothetical protein